MENLSGQQIKGYELRDRLGAGGFGAVYSAYQAQIGREVAVKVILPSFANHPDFIRRFELEARVIARLEHPHIIPLYDYWRDANGAYIVMRYLRGGNLRQVVKERTFTLQETSRLLDQLAGALAVAHRHGVVHRDIKPDNILLDEINNPYLTDFGIAKDLANDSGVTQADMVIGSPAYLSPEQIRGEEVTGQSDIYSLGIVLYELLAGAHPYEDQTVTALLVKHLNEPLPPLTARREDIPQDVELIIQRATAKNPAERFPDAPTMAAAFRQAVQMEAEGISTSQRLLNVTLDRTLLLEEIDIDNPYKGLAAFEEVDANNFFGRDTLIDHLLTRLREQQLNEHFLAIIGPSGSGKSSVVQAGLIPRMRSGTLPGSSNWFIVEMVPGSRPLEELEAALLRVAVNPPTSLLTQIKEDERGLIRATKRILADNRSEIFLFIDQFEQVFTHARDKAEVTHFLNSLVAAATDPECRLRIVITLRADFYDKPLLYPAFGDLVRRFSEVVLPMSEVELERAIVGPAERVGVVLEPGLVTQIIADVSEEPGALPLMQYALTELFEKRSGRVMTLEAYHHIGGALGALARRADEQYQELNEAERELARQLFLRLVTIGDGGSDDTRRRVLHSEMMSIAPDIEQIVTVFGRSRLLTFDHDPITREPTIEVAHEAIIRQWQQLRGWLDESREDLINQRRLAAAAAEWQRSDQDPSYLATGARLEQIEEWQRESRLALSQEENEYLQKSMAEREQRLAAENARQAREKALEQRSRARLRLLVVVMGVALVIAIVLTSVAVTANDEAQAARSLAESNAEAARLSADEARSFALDANARNLLTAHNPPLALALAIEAYQAYQPPAAEVQQTLAQAAYGPNARFRWELDSGSITGVSTNGTVSLAVTADGRVVLVDFSTGEPSGPAFDLGGESAFSVDLSADGTQAVTGLYSGDILLWDVATGEVLQRFSGHSDVVSDVALRDGRVLSGSLDRSVRLWDAESGEALQVIETPGAILRVVFSPDNLLAASSSADVTAGAGHPPEERDRTIRVWNLESGEEVQRFEPNSGFVRAIDYSPDGRYILSGTWNSVDDGTLQLWNIETGLLERRFYGAHSDIITDVHFNTDGSRILSASWDRSVRVWDVTTGLELERFESHADRVLSAAFTPDESYIVTGTGNIGNNIPNPASDAPADTSIWLWDLRNRAQIHALEGHTDWIWSVAVSPDGQVGATGSGPISLPAGGGSDITVRLWDLESGEEIRAFEGHTNTINWVSFSPDGEHVLSAGWDNTVRENDVNSGESREAFTGHTDRVFSAVYHPDGTQALSASRDRTVRLWDVATGEEIRVLEGHEGDVNSAVFSPDGSLIASASSDQTIRLWDAATGEEIRVLEGKAVI